MPRSMRFYYLNLSAYPRQILVWRIELHCKYVYQHLEEGAAERSVVYTFGNWVLWDILSQTSCRDLPRAFNMQPYHKTRGKLHH